MTSCLKPRDPVREIAQSFLSFLRVRGISTRFQPRVTRQQMKTASEANSTFSADLERRIREFLDTHQLWRCSDLESLGQIPLDLKVKKRVFVPCRLISQADQRIFPRPRSRDVPIHLEEVNALTACFGCLFVREGFSHLRDMDAMDDLRAIVVSTLEELGYSLEEDYAVGIGLPVLADWQGCPNYFCLAKKEGAIRRVYQQSFQQLKLAVVF